MKETIYMQRLGDERIERVLFFIKSEIVRDGLDGVEHVDALLQMRGIDPDKFKIPAKIPRIFKGRNGMRRAVLLALKQGPASTKEIASRICEANEGICVEETWRSVSVCLSGLKRRGTVTKTDVWRSPVWGLAQ